jgi:hypothetical protein
MHRFQIQLSHLYLGDLCRKFTKLIDGRTIPYGAKLYHGKVFTYGSLVCLILEITGIEPTVEIREKHEQYRKIRHVYQTLCEWVLETLNHQLSTLPAMLPASPVDIFDSCGYHTLIEYEPQQHRAISRQMPCEYKYEFEIIIKYLSNLSLSESITALISDYFFDVAYAKPVSIFK